MSAKAKPLIIVFVDSLNLVVAIIRIVDVTIFITHAESHPKFVGVQYGLEIQIVGALANTGLRCLTNGHANIANQFLHAIQTIQHVRIIAIVTTYAAIAMIYMRFAHARQIKFLTLRKVYWSLLNPKSHSIFLLLTFPRSCCHLILY